MSEIMIDLRKFGEVKEEFIEERRISFDDLEMLCYRNKWGNRIDSNMLKGFIYIVSTRKYLETEDIVAIAEKLLSWSEDDTPLIKAVNQVGERVRSKIYIVPKGDSNDNA